MLDFFKKTQEIKRRKSHAFDVGKVGFTKSWQVWKERTNELRIKMFYYSKFLKENGCCSNHF